MTKKEEIIQRFIKQFGSTWNQNMAGDLYEITVEDYGEDITYEIIDALNMYACSRGN